MVMLYITRGYLQSNPIKSHKITIAHSYVSHYQRVSRAPRLPCFSPLLLRSVAPLLLHLGHRALDDDVHPQHDNNQRGITLR